MGSTDLGNVSYLLPAIHPMVQIAPEGVAIHTEDFASFARSSDGDRGVVDGAKALAMTAWDIWTSEHLRERSHDEWRRISTPEGLLG